MIAEVASVDTMNAFVPIGSECANSRASNTPPGDEQDGSLEWMKDVLAGLDVEDERKGAGSDDDGEGGCCLGRRMGCFESVEAEEWEMWGRYSWIARREGQEAPTRVLFDWRRPTVAAVAAEEAGGESGGGSGEEGGAVNKEKGMEKEMSSGK